MAVGPAGCADKLRSVWFNQLVGSAVGEAGARAAVTRAEDARVGVCSNRSRKADRRRSKDLVSLICGIPFITRRAIYLCHRSCHRGEFNDYADCDDKCEMLFST